MNSAQERAAELTALLRSSEDPLWRRLRSLLEAKGLKPMTVTVADLSRDDTSLEFGLIVTPDHRVFQFDFDYLHKTVSHRNTLKRQPLDRTRFVRRSTPALARSGQCDT